jgi:predicted transcriptional regulator
MDIQLEKLKLIKKLAETDDFAIIESIKKIFQKEKKDWWEKLSDEQKAAIEQGERDIENGESVTSEEFFELLKAK